jgi:murein DD-endopeptidase MepM/ murein hydrolase activator NlpD
MGGVFNLVNMHLYHYAGTNPVKYVDPDGRDDEEPSDYIPEVIPIPETKKSLPSNFAIWPLVGGNGEADVSGSFGYEENPLRPGTIRHHGGADIKAPIGTEVVSVMDGNVATVGSDRVYGNFIEINHKDGVSTKYGHLKEVPQLRVGQTLQRGSIIGLTGNTGASTGPHLHFEYKVNGEKRDAFDGLFTQGIIQVRRAR